MSKETMGLEYLPGLGMCQRGMDSRELLLKPLAVAYRRCRGAQQGCLTLFKGVGLFKGDDV